MAREGGRVCLLGSGNVAHSIALSLSEGKYRLSGVYSRDIAKARRLAEAYGQGIAATDDLRTLPEAEVYVICVTDDAIGEVASRAVGSEDALWVHTCGSVGIEALGSKVRRGVVYPLQTFTAAEPRPLADVPLLVEGDEEAEALARTLSRDVRRADSLSRRKYHLAGVIANNFVNHLYARAFEYLDREGLDPAVLRPIIAETTRRALTMEPRRVQTGPARRGNRPILNLHIEMLRGSEMEGIYRTLTESIIKLYEDEQH